MFRNRSVRLLLLASAMIPATATFGVLKMQAQVTPDAPVLLAAPAQAVAAVKCAELVGTNATGWPSKEAALQNLKANLNDYCQASGCVSDEASITTEKVPPRNPGTTPDLGGGTTWNAYGKCKDKPLAAPAPVNPMLPAE